MDKQSRPFLCNETDVESTGTDILAVIHLTNVRGLCHVQPTMISEEKEERFTWIVIMSNVSTSISRRSICKGEATISAIPTAVVRFRVGDAAILQKPVLRLTEVVTMVTQFSWTVNMFDAVLDMVCPISIWRGIDGTINGDIITTVAKC